jgi:hypothetical protein
MLAVLTAASVGCGCWERWRRGPHCDACPTTGGCPAPGPYSPGAMNAAPAETYLPAPG